MRNGVYRVWVQGLGRPFSGVAALKDGALFAAGKEFVYNGTVSTRGDWLTGDIAVKRLYPAAPTTPFGDRETLHIAIEGHTGREVAQLSGTIAEAPETPLSVEFAFLCEA